MTKFNALVYVDDDPLLTELIRGWAARANLAWHAQARTLEEAMEICVRGGPPSPGFGAASRIVLLSTEIIGLRWKEVAVQLDSLESKPAVVLFAKQFSEAFLYCSRRAPITGVISRSVEAEKEFRHAVAAARAGGRWFCPAWEEAAAAFEKSPQAFFKILSAKELGLLRYFGLGMPDHVIAEQRDLAPSTIQTHRKNVMKKLGLHSARDLVCWAIARGVVSAADFPGQPRHQEQVLSGI